MSKIKGMILAAGLGTRLKPWTDQHPKALAIVNGKSLLERNVEYLRSYGIDEVIVNVHHFADQIVEAVEKNNGWGSRVTISDETDAVLETGGGLKKAGWFLDGGTFVLMNVDILGNLDLSAVLKQHADKRPLATLVTRSRTTSRYLLFDDQNTLCGWRNTSTGEEKWSRPAEISFEKAFSGIHVVDPKIFSLIQQDGKFSMVDLYLSLATHHAIQAFDDHSGAFIDVGKPESIAAAEKLFV